MLSPIIADQEISRKDVLFFHYVCDYPFTPYIKEVSGMVTDYFRTLDGTDFISVHTSHIDGKECVRRLIFCTDKIVVNTFRLSRGERKHAI